MRIKFTTILLHALCWIVTSSSLDEEFQTPLAADSTNKNNRLDDVESQQDVSVPTSNLRTRQRITTAIHGDDNTNNVTDAEAETHHTSVSSERQLQTAITMTRISVRNVNTGKEIITDLIDGQIIQLNEYGLTKASEINFQAYHTGDPTKIGSMAFGYDRNPFFFTDGFEPFTFCGNFGPTFFLACPKLTIGPHTIQATPYSGPGNTGIVLAPTLVRQFTLVFQLPPTLTSSPPPPISPIPPPPITPIPPPPITPWIPPQAPVYVPPKPPTPVKVPPKPPTPVKVPPKPPTPVYVPPKPPTPAFSSVPPPTLCPVPMLVGEWEKITAYPLDIAESIGGTMTNLDGTKDIVVFSGFSNAWTATTRAVYAYNTQQPNLLTATWRRMDDIPHPIGLTHSGFVIMKGGATMYMCGGYVGGTPGAETNLCYKYEHQKPRTKQWSYLPPLPQGRSGGALLYLVSNNSLLFATGATRSDPKDPTDSTDFSTAWELSLNGNVALNKWEPRADTIYKGNHVSFASVGSRSFLFGGQVEEDEHHGNLDNVAEYIVPTGKWISRKSMNFPRGHSSSSSRATPNGCGIVTVGGAVNNRKKTSDISFYSVANDTWTSIGALPIAINTPVCDFVSVSPENHYLYCVSGFIHEPYAYRRRIANI